MRSVNVTIVGATGLVGETLARVLEERRWSVGELRLFASARSGERASYALGRRVRIEALDARQPPPFASSEVVFFAAGSGVSLALAPRAAEGGTLVIDKSAAFRLYPDVPLVVPEVNPNALGSHRFIANPNCAAIPLAVMLGPIYRRFGLRWVSVATYQSVSGAGREAMNQFERELAGETSPASPLPHRIAGNVFPENGPFDEGGYSEEERKIAAELKKILSDEAIDVSATSVRVPVAVGHCEAVSFQTQQWATIQDIAQTLREAPGVSFQDGAGYQTPVSMRGNDEVAVGRLRPDHAHPGAFLAWVVCDNLRKGAATNAVQIAEAVLARARAAV